MRKAFKWVGIVLGGIIVLLMIAVAAVYLITNSRFHEKYNVQVADLTISADSASIARGHHVATVRGCVDCHGENLAGKPFMEDPAIGYLYAANLTTGKGGVGGNMSDADWVRAIRHGVRPDGTPLLWMPSQEFNGLSNQDLSDLIAYLESVPPVDHTQPANSVGPLGRTLYLAGILPLLPVELIDHSAKQVEAVTPGPTAEYGEYLAATCAGCHGEHFSGGKMPGAPPSMPIPLNITPDKETGIGNWTEADFSRALRDGKRPDGTQLDPFMPYRVFKHMSDDEVQALWAFLQTLPPRTFGGR
ncbi:MAG TPA: c-type cytochrome [Rhodothermales bacterium]|nr:c-type cytochrome [Rhodothermales bacterium]